MKGIISCCICASEKIYFKDKFWVCSDCGYETAGIFNLSELENYYNKDDPGSRIQTFLENTLDGKLRKYHNTVLQRLGSDDASKLQACDIGCSTGTFAYKLKKMGFNVFGYDVERDHVNLARNKYGLTNIHYAKTFREYCQKIGVGQNFFDIITMFELIEHLPDINLFLEEVTAFLKPGGLLVISTPNSRRLKIKESWNYPPIHLSRFNCDNLKMLLNKFGFDVQLLEFYNELGYYSNNLIHKTRFSRSFVQSIMTSGSNKKTENFIRLKLRVLIQLKSFICKIIDIPLFLFLLIKKEWGHTMIIIARKTNKQS
ncbi:MAG: class I SAM-dependent methyltransferase, partial [Patescibacteria group bacterium]